MFKGSLADSVKNRERSDIAWDSWQKNFLPIDAKIAADSMNYDNPLEIARREGLAAGTVQGQIDTQRGDTTRELGRMGVSAGRAGQALVSDTNELALAKAGAINKERGNAQLTGISLRQTAAGIGRGLTGVGIGAGTAAQGNQSAAQGTAGAGQNFRAGALDQYLRPASLAMSANTSAGNLLLGQYDAQMRGYESNQAGIGSLIGAGASLGGAYLGYMGMAAL
ncbi:MAG TPA: hypothetical protein PKV98_19505 [Burkholderiaceae bacterium]|nr:hypothetical protein [Burkholderiaceae bacterium]